MNMAVRGLPFALCSLNSLPDLLFSFEYQSGLSCCFLDTKFHLPRLDQLVQKSMGFSFDDRLFIHVFVHALHLQYDKRH